MEKVRVGIIGAGSISDMHFQSYVRHEAVELVAVCDLNEARAMAKAEQHKIEKIYTDYHELLKNEDVDAVSICTWNNSHAEIAIAALEHNKHVLVEKPLSKTAEEAEKIREVSQKSDKTLQVGFVRRFATNTEVLKKFIDAGDLGEIYYAKASSLRVLGNPGGWFSDVERSGGGPLIDIGVHVIDICWYLMGKPKVKSVSGTVYHKLGNRSNIEHKSFYQAADYDPKQNSVEDLANALIKFENGATLMLDASFALHAKEDKTEVHLFGDKGGAMIEPELNIFTEKHNILLDLTPKIDARTFDFEKGFQNEIDHFVACCLEKETTISPVEDGIEIMKILEAIYESSRSGREVRFN
ncbi:Gfo/Idh/MocA family protein [Amphibacillus jilinensis]|uniref:Gfo/Idh/MocA family protein n=1 Tax=Amphibacillus jilinensis TaxID=1216008 RepID=UPI00030844FF|nr:Gfo/Idh/MocA family oxidoreductase [Amphibacillus jilinensis]